MGTQLFREPKIRYLHDYMKLLYFSPFNQPTAIDACCLVSGLQAKPFPGPDFHRLTIDSFQGTPRVLCCLRRKLLPSNAMPELLFILVYLSYQKSKCWQKHYQEESNSQNPTQPLLLCMVHPIEKHDRKNQSLQ